MLLVPCTIIFNGCGDNVYRLSKFDDDLKEIADRYDCIVMSESGLVFNYDSFVDGEDKYLNNIIATKKPYTYLNDYNILFNNLMIFVNSYADECSDNNINVDAGLRNQLKRDLEDLNNDLLVIENNTNTWAMIMKGAYKEYDVSVEQNCLVRFKDLLSYYDDLFVSATNLSNTLSSIYFDHALIDSNPNYYEIPYAEFDARVVVNKLDPRIKYEISNLTQCFIEMRIAGSNLPESLTSVASGYGSLDLNVDNYANKVKELSLPTDFDWSVAIERANHESNKQAFYSESIRLYNIQEVFEDNVGRFITACNDIDYKDVATDANATTYELMCKDNIDSHYFLVDQYYNTLNTLLAYMGA